MSKCNVEKGNKRKRVLVYQEIMPEKKSKIDEKDYLEEDAGEDGDEKKSKRDSEEDGMQKKWWT